MLTTEKRTNEIPLGLDPLISIELNNLESEGLNLIPECNHNFWKNVIAKLRVSSGDEGYANYTYTCATLNAIRMLTLGMSPETIGAIIAETVPAKKQSLVIRLINKSLSKSKTTEPEEPATSCSR